MLRFLKLLILTNRPSWSAASFFSSVALVASQQHAVDTDDVHFPNNTEKWCQSWSVSFHLWSLRKARAGVSPSCNPTALLAPYLTHPLGLPDIRNSVYSTLRLHTRQAHQEHLTLWGKDNQHLLSLAADSPFSVASVNPFDVSRWRFVQMCFYQLMCFSHLLCLARAAPELCVPILPAKMWAKLPDERHVTRGKQ